MTRRIKLDLSEAEAAALYSYAIEGECDADSREFEGMHPSTRAAGARALQKLGSAVLRT